MNARALLVGIGSSHGDDRVGWEIASRVAELARGSIMVRCARSPAQLLDWLDGIESLDVCDAVSSAASGSVYCWNWPAPELAHTAFHTSHNLSLPAVLELAGVLGCLPRQVRIWGVGIETGRSLELLSPDAASAASIVADRICGTHGYA